MPKRIPTPPPADDEPRYLTVVHPYVPDGHCNMELPKDRQDFARWVACCIDNKYIYAFFHKPSARDMVILEVARECPQLDRLLGEHSWGEFLRNPNKQYKDKVSKVFYCTYSTGRLVQKNGWKRIYVEDAWFATWSARNHFITFPYPETHFCDVPIEDQTNHPMCRPLPGAVKPPPPEVLAAPAPVVGSDDWISGKHLLAPVAKPAVSAWSKPIGNSWKAAIATSSPAIPGIKKQPAVGGGTITVKASDVRIGLPLPPANASNGWVDSPTDSGRDTPPRSASSVASPSQPPSIPPGLSGKRAWNGASSYLTRPPGIPAVPNIETAPSLSRDNISSTSWSSRRTSSSADTDIVITPETEDPYTVRVTISDSMETALDQLSIEDRYLQDEMDPDLTGLDSIAPGNWDEPTGAQVTWSEYTGGGDEVTWDDAPADAESLWNQSTGPKETEKAIVCNAHGIICKKGICREYAKQLREVERAKKAVTTDPKRGRGRGRGRGGAFGRGGTGDRGGAFGGAFRGRGAPVKTNWRGTPRAIVSAEAIEERENVKDAESVADPSNAWGNTSDAAWVPAAEEEAPEPPESDEWSKSEASYDPWSLVPAKPKPQPKFESQPQRNSKPQPNTQSKPQWNTKPKSQAWSQTNSKINTNAKIKSTWADEMDAHSAAGYPENDNASFTTSSSKRGGRTTKAPKSSASGMGHCGRAALVSASSC